METIPGTLMHNNLDRVLDKMYCYETLPFLLPVAVSQLQQKKNKKKQFFFYKIIKKGGGRGEGEGKKKKKKKETL
jgi:hypothetical protein